MYSVCLGIINSCAVRGLVLFIVAFYTICHIYDYCTSVVVFNPQGLAGSHSRIYSLKSYVIRCEWGMLSSVGEPLLGLADPEAIR